MKIVKYTLIAAAFAVFAASIHAGNGAPQVPALGNNTRAADSVAVSAGSRNVQQGQTQASVQRPTRRTTNWSKIKNLFE